MKKVEGYLQPEKWGEFTIKQFSDYNIAAEVYSSKIDELGGGEESDEAILAQYLLYGEIFKAVTGLSSDEIDSININRVKAFVDEMSFLQFEYKPININSFNFKGKEYSFPDSLPINTKFGQYMEAMQRRLVEGHREKDSILYMAHQLAHMVELDEGWDSESRDFLAVEFEALTMDVAFEFSFFLNKKLEIYSLAWLQYEKVQHRKSLPFIKRTLMDLVGLRHYLSWRRVVSSINQIRIQLIALRTQIQAKYFYIYRIFQRKAITSKS